MKNYQLVNRIDTHFQGQAGSRIFYILIEKNTDICLLWIEKDQLISLGRACSQLLADNIVAIEKNRITALEEIEFPLTPSLEINLLRIGVDYLASEDHIIILFDDQESIENGESPKLRIELSRKMTNEFIEKTRLLASTGRPTCPLCHKIVEEDGNCLFCPKKNGHSKDADLPKLI